MAWARPEVIGWKTTWKVVVLPTARVLTEGWAVTANSEALGPVRRTRLVPPLARPVRFRETRASEALARVKVSVTGRLKPTVPKSVPLDVDGVRLRSWI